MTFKQMRNTVDEHLNTIEPDNIDRSRYVNFGMKKMEELLDKEYIQEDGEHIITWRRVPLLGFVPFIKRKP